MTQLGMMRRLCSMHSLCVLKVQLVNSYLYLTLLILVKLCYIVEMTTKKTFNHNKPYSIDPPSFKVDPLSPEHAKQVERFQGYPYNAEAVACQKAYSIFKEWHHRLQLDQQALLEEEDIKEEKRLK